MIKTFSIVFIFLFLVSCGKSGSDSSNPVSSVSLSEISTSSPVPSAAQNFEVDLKLNNFDANQEDKVLVASDLIKKVVATEEFKNAILNYTYQGKKTFVDNDGLSNAEIYQKILEGSEKLHPGKNNQMDLEIEIYQANTTVIGYTLPNELKIWMNAKFFNQNMAPKVSENMMHEWLHKIGFKHDFASTPSRPFSVPYAIGYLVGRIAMKF